MAVNDSKVPHTKNPNKTTLHLKSLSLQQNPIGKAWYKHFKRHLDFSFSPFENKVLRYV